MCASFQRLPPTPVVVVVGESVLGLPVGNITSALDEAVNAAYDLGVIPVVLVGSLNQDARRRSPTRAEHAVAVAAAGWNRSRASCSSLGSLVDISAAGSPRPNLSSLDSWTATLPGTSNAAPHITGLMAHLRAKEDLGTPDVGSVCCGGGPSGHCGPGGHQRRCFRQKCRIPQS